MKLKIALIAAALALTGCQAYHGPVVGEHQVGQISYKGGTGLVYTRSTQQVSKESLNAGDEMEERRRNSPLSKAINESVARGDAFQEEQDRREAAQNKCKFIVEAHEAVLTENAIKTMSDKDRLALIHYRSSGKVRAFNKCMQNANK